VTQSEESGASSRMTVSTENAGEMVRRGSKKRKSHPFISLMDRGGRTEESATKE